jgi:hypothetical protein
MVVRVELRLSLVVLVLWVWEWGERPCHVLTFGLAGSGAQCVHQGSLP